MLKLTGFVDNTKKIHGSTIQKYVLATGSENTIALDGANLIPIDLGGRLVTHYSNVSINELGKQLLKAAADGNVEEVKTLLSRGAPFTSDWLGTSPLHFAAQNNHLEITRILLRAGISKNARTKVDRTPLHMAVFEGHTEIVDALVSHGVDVNCKDLLLMTPLHWAVQNGFHNIVDYLVKHGAKVIVCNKFGLCPVDIAQQIGRPDIETYLKGKLAENSLDTQNFVINLASENMTEGEEKSMPQDMELENSNHESIVIPIEPHILQTLEQNQAELDEDEDSQLEKENHTQEQDLEMIEKETEQLVQNVDVDASSYPDSLKLLQEHGITMIQTDENEDSSILNSVMENGHTVVLTDVGKEVLNSLKEMEQKKLQTEKKLVSLTPDEIYAMANGVMCNKNANKQLRVLSGKNQVKRLVLGKKSKIVPVTSTESKDSIVVSDENEESESSPEKPSRTDMELVMTQLIQARKTIEEYKMKLFKKDQELERYKMQLKLLMDP